MLNTQFAYSSSFGRLPVFNGSDRPAAARPADPEIPNRDDPVQAQEESNPAEARPLRETTRELVKEMNRALQQVNTGLEFSQDDETGQTVIKVVDRETRETIRQFPSEEALAIARSLEKSTGVLLRQTA